MTEKRDPYFFLGPEAKPEDTHHRLTEIVRATAEKLWVPGPEPNTYSYGRSAAGLHVECTLPAQFSDDEKAPNLVLRVIGPSNRFNDAAHRTTGICMKSRAATFIVYDVNRETKLKHPGVECFLENSKHDKTNTDWEGPLPYADFLRLINYAGICEPASRGQRLARGAIGLVSCFRTTGPTA